MLEANLPQLEKLEGGKNAALAEALRLSAQCPLPSALAVERLERALSLEVAIHGTKLELGEVHWALGRAQWALGHKAQALEAVRAAEAELANDASVAATLRQVRAWLKAHP